MSTIPYVFYTYSIINDSTEEPVDPSRHFSIFKSIHKTPIAYRVSDPSEADKDTSLVILKDRKINDVRAISFYINKRLALRKINLYHRIKDEYEDSVENTSDNARSLFVVVPHLKKIAVQDKAGEHNLNANSAMGRLKRILFDIAEHRLISEYAASAEEIRQAFKAWSIEQVNFSARPYNPHPHTPGDRLSALMSDNNSTLAGTIKARKGKLEQVKEGVIGEVIGLSERGYAEIGARGKTKQGYMAHIVKRNLEEDLNEPAKIRIMFPERGELEDHISDIIEAMGQIYEPKS